MTEWDITYTVEPTNHNGTFTVENDSMSRGIAQRYVVDHVLRTSNVALDAFDQTDITVSYEPNID
jgi:hypothetical protein